MLVIQNPRTPMCLDMDASGVGLGALLSQGGEDGREQVLGFSSRTLTRAEKKYCITRVTGRYL